jgi:hypothetical protein
MKKYAGNWITIDANQFNRIQKGERAGAKLEIAPSPYDLPEAIRAHVEDSTGAFVIDIRYITSEPTAPQNAFPLSVFRGSGSGRIYQIKVLTPDDPEWTMDPLGKMHEALRSLETSENDSRNQSIAIVEEILQSEQENLFPNSWKAAHAEKDETGIEHASAASARRYSQSGLIKTGIRAAEASDTEQASPAAQLSGASAAAAMVAPQTENPGKKVI